MKLLVVGKEQDLETGTSRGPWQRECKASVEPPPVFALRAGPNSLPGLKASLASLHT